MRNGYIFEEGFHYMSMRRRRKVAVFLTFTVLVVFSCGAAQAAQIELVGGKPTTGWYAGDTVLMHAVVTFTFQLNQTAPCTLVAFTNGFEVYTKLSEANPTTSGYFDPVQGDTLLITHGWIYWPPVRYGYFDDVFIGGYSDDGLGKDTIGFGGFWTSGKAPGLPVGWSDDVWYVRTTPHTDGDTLCIDSCWFRPSNDWIWSLMPPCDPDEIFPTFGGPYCYHVYKPSIPPTFNNCPPSLTFDHCLPASYDFDATDPDRPFPLIYKLLSGPGTIDSLTGRWTYQPSINDVGVFNPLYVEVCDSYSRSSCDTCATNLIFTNIAPTLICPVDTIRIGAGNTAQLQCTGDAGDCDPLDWLITDVTPTPGGSYDIDTTGLLTFSPNPSDSGLYSFNVCVTDGFDSVCCTVCFDVVACCVGGIRGNVDAISGINVADVTYLVDYLFRGGPPPPCAEDADVNSDTRINIADLTFLVDYLFRSGPEPAPCP
jgi:hypothetical protein